MSFEGYIQRLCANGHLDRIDVYCESDKDRCRWCGEKYVWEHTVDQTNGNEESNGEVLLQEVQPAIRERCESCGNVEMIEPSRWRIPK